MKFVHSMDGQHVKYFLESQLNKKLKMGDNKDFGNLCKMSSRISPLHLSQVNEIYVFASIRSISLS